MMRALIALVALSSLAAPVAAQDCTPQPLIFVYWGSYGAGIVPETSATVNWVPDGEFWWIQAAAVSIDVPAGTQLPPGDYIIHDDTRYPVSSALWYMTAIAKAQGTNTTPVVAINRPYWLLAGHRLNARTNVPLPLNVRMGITMTGLKYPMACFGLVFGPAVSREYPQ
jgi:hypothetical protein